MVAQLWPNINAAGSKMIKDIAEPMFKTMLPGPLKTLHFTKIDLGPVPLRLSNVLAVKSDTGGIKLDMNVDWDGECNIELDGEMIPKLVSCGPSYHPHCLASSQLIISQGVKHVGLHGRLSILLGPLTNIIPLVSHPILYLTAAIGLVK